MASTAGALPHSSEVDEETVGLPIAAGVVLVARQVLTLGHDSAILESFLARALLEDSNCAIRAKPQTEKPLSTPL